MKDKNLNDVIIPDKNLICSIVNNSIKEMRKDGYNFLEIGYALIMLIHDCLYDVEQEEIYNV